MMKHRGIRALVVLATAVSTLIGASATPSSAAGASAAVFTGNGTFTPGIPGPTGGTVTNSIAMQGSVIGVFASNGATAGSCSFSLSGSGSFSSATGSGSASASCAGTGVTGAPIQYNCNSNFTAVGGIWIWTGACSGSAQGTMIWICVNVPTTVNPTTKSQIICKIIWVG